MRAPVVVAWVGGEFEQGGLSRLMPVGETRPTDEVECVTAPRPCFEVVFLWRVFAVISE